MDKQCSGQQTPITWQKVKEMKEHLDEDRHIVVREVSQRIYCSAETVHTNNHDSLNMRRLL